MKETKTCPQCGEVFIGQSNRLYCSDPCKMEAFRAGKTRKSNEAIEEISNPLTPVIITDQPSRVPKPSAWSATDKSSKVDLEIRRLELEHDRQMRQMELDEEERCRTHEQVLARIQADEKGQDQEAQLQKLTQQVDELQRRAIAPLDEWAHFPIGIRRQYQALVYAALKAAKESMNELACNQWLDNYRPYNRAVQDLVTANCIPAQASKPFIWLADLAQQIEAHRHAHHWSDKKQDLMLILSPELRQQLMQACL